MKVLVSGASGRVGEELVKNLVADGHQVVAGTRHIDQDFGAGVEVKNIDLLDNEATLVDELQALELDAIYFVAGSRGKDLLQVDAFGAVKLSTAADKLGITRFIMLSSWQSLQPSEWKVERMMNYNIAKFFGDNWLIDHTELDYTILQPVDLVEEPVTGKVDLDPKDAGTGTNTIGDVAKVLSEMLERENTFKRVISMRQGETSIKSALDTFK